MYCDLRAAGGLALYCNTMHSQDRQPCRDTTGWALGWACWARRQALGRWGDRRAGASRRTGVSGRGRTRRRQAAVGATGVGGVQAWAQAWARGESGVGVRGARPGRACARRLGVLASQLGQVGALCTWLSSDSVFRPGSTQYYS